jgi:hypothetical protein
MGYILHLICKNNQNLTPVYYNDNSLNLGEARRGNHQDHVSSRLIYCFAHAVERIVKTGVQSTVYLAGTREAWCGGNSPRKLFSIK